MVKIQYKGDMSPIRIDVKGTVLYWKRDEIKNLDKQTAETLMLNSRFIKVEAKKEKEENKPLKIEKKIKVTDKKYEDE